MAGHIESTVRRPRAMTAGTQLTLLIQHGTLPPPMGWCHPHSWALPFPVKPLWSPLSPQQTQPEVLFHGNSKHCQVASEDQPSPELNSKAANTIANRTQSGSDESAALGEGHSLEMTDCIIPSTGRSLHSSWLGKSGAEITIISHFVL